MLRCLLGGTAEGQGVSHSTEPSGVKCVLVADDDDALRALLVRGLRPLAVVTAVADGESALAALRAGRFDAIVADFCLPGMDGLEFARRVRSEGAGAGVPILMISGMGGIPDPASREPGIDGFLAKPFRLEELRAKVAALLDKG